MWILLSLVAVLAIGLCMAMRVDSPNRKEASQLQFAQVQFSNLKDGTYVGQWNGSTSHVRDTKVEVEIADGKVAHFKILKGAVGKDGQPVKLSKGRTIEELFQAVVDQQSLAVDVISGATVTSKTHLKAFENALVQAGQ
ncbi:MAG: FMN-binding protein [Sphaerochaeta sp.]|uniref:FMN-binding domain protein n=2 Tax=Sphaerochaeta TaxID=399320 RepID=F0RSF2_SPHGB|nr:FMN-binding domain protein [Sphaerochaeta globosa str. Buddy]